MKKVIGIALVLAVVATLCFGSVALAADPQNVHTEWEFNGEGEINIHTEKSGGTEGSDDLYIESYGSGSSGWQNVSATPHGYAWSGTNFVVDRHVDIEDGFVFTETVRDNNYPYWQADTTYGAYLDVDSEGSLDQHFSNSYSYANMNTSLSATCDGSSYDMGAYTEGWIGGYFGFGIGIDGEGEGELHLNTTDRAEHNGWRLMYGGFYAGGDTNAGIGGAWATLADFSGQVDTPNITTYFDLDVSGSGSYEIGASASWVEIEGFINGMK